MASASANTEAWARDPVADANPDLTRKRQRLSEETETPPLSTDDSIRIELLPPEETGASYGNAIELHDDDDDDDDDDMYSAQFELVPEVAHLQPVAQLERLFQTINNNRTSLEPFIVANLLSWLAVHLDDTHRETKAQWLDGYTTDYDFFALLGQTVFRLLQRHDLYENINRSRFAEDDMCRMTGKLYDALAELCVRMVIILPELIDKTLARRDSGRVSQTRQPVDFNTYVVILGHLLQLRPTPASAHFKRVCGFKPKPWAAEWIDSFLTDDAIPTHVLRALEKFARNHAQIDGPWDAIEVMLRLNHSYQLDSAEKLQRLLAAVSEDILPVVCNKHPNALPEDFHKLCIQTGERAIGLVICQGDTALVGAIYDRFIKSDNDALLPESSGDVPIAQSLTQTAGGNRDNVAEMLSTAWALQALKAFIFSEIMNVRSTGMAVFSDKLVAIHGKHKSSNSADEHPVLQYVARFVRSNELTKYIFGPNSHASLVTHSKNIISFLGVTSAYTNLETDIIWHACTTSVEAEFVKASFTILSDLRRHLDLDQLVYMAGKYASTSPAKLGRDAVDSLEDLLKELHLQEDAKGRRCPATADICIDIMMSASDCESNSALLKLRSIAHNELLRFSKPVFGAEDRAQIYKRCVPELARASAHATTSVEILLIFLRTKVPPEESHDLLAMLPVSTAVEELGKYIERLRCVEMRPQDVQGTLRLRLELIMRLLSISDGAVDDETRRSLYRYIVGDLALHNAARDAAWLELGAMTQLRGLSSSPAAKDVLDCFLEEALLLPLHLMTPSLIGLLGKVLAQKSPLSEDHTLLLNSPVWQKLIQAAESPLTPIVNDSATMAVCAILFDWPSALPNKDAAVRCHGDVARRQLNHICDVFSRMSHSSETTADSDVLQSLSVLEAILHKSRKTQQAYQQAVQPELHLVADTDETVWACQLQLYGGSQPRIVKAHVSRSTKLADFIAALPPLTGAEDNRIIVGGKSLELKPAASTTLAEVGVHDSATIMVCPRHSLNSNLSIVFAPSGAVEREILAHYDQLQKLLDGPDSIAEKVFTFMTFISPPPETRTWVAITATSTSELFPRDRPWRSVFSLHVLGHHLFDFAKLGVAEEHFLERGVRMMVDVLCDQDRSIQPIVCLRALECLFSFLQERPAERSESPAPNEVVPDAGCLISCIIDVCFYAVQQHPSGNVVSRATLANHAFATLLQAFRRQPSTWNAFKQHARVTELHSLMLLDHDYALSARATTAIQHFCQDTTVPADVADFYMKLTLAILPSALVCRPLAAQFFDLATEILLANRFLSSDESRVRDISELLFQSLQDYDHQESVDLGIADVVVTGLLKLLNAAIEILRSFKKAVQLPAVAPFVLRRLLFPPLKESYSRPLVHTHSRHLAYSLVRSACDSPSEFAEILHCLHPPMNSTSSDPVQKYAGYQDWIRPATRCSGLVNLGMTCYMNSLLQQLFANVSFRKFILEIPIADLSRQAVLNEVQGLFANMQNHYELAINTTDLAKVLCIQTDSQEDVHGFYADFLSRLEAEMPDQQAKLALNGFYSGKLISQIKGECGHVSPKTEPFVDLPIIVKNKNSLQDSLDEFVQGEPMEGANRYRCMACDPAGGGRLVNAMKRACPDELPDNLTFCLKRFTFDAYGQDDKVNDRFEFPESIDMSVYLRSHLEDPTSTTQHDLFELVGVIVHQGVMNLGHYWSYTLLRNTSEPNVRTWVKLEDRSVTTCPEGVIDVQRECFGGQRWMNGSERADNAYVLFYQRKASLEERIALPGPPFDPITHHLLPPKVALPSRLFERLHEANDWRYLIAHLFDKDFYSLMTWALEKYPDLAAKMTPSSDSPQEHATTLEAELEQVTVPTDDELMNPMCELAVLFVSRVAVCDPTPLKKLQPYLKGLSALVDANLAMAPKILFPLSDAVWFQRLLMNTDRNVRLPVTDFMARGLAIVREYDLASYDDVWGRLLTAHVSHLWDGDRMLSMDWGDYLSFAAQLAGHGPAETGRVLDGNYLRWAFEMLLLPWQAILRKRHSAAMGDLVKCNSLKVSAVYNFIFDILSHHVDLSDPNVRREPRGTRREITDAGVTLQPVEIEYMASTATKGIPCWILSARFASTDGCSLQLPLAGTNESTNTAGRASQNFAPSNVLHLLLTRIPAMAPQIAQWLVAFIDAEQKNLPVLLLLVANFCTSCQDPQHAAVVIRAMSKSIGQWDGPLDFVAAMAVAYEAWPRQVLECAFPWTVTLLAADDEKVRRNVAHWFETVFSCDPISDDMSTDAVRARLARRLCDRLFPELQAAYNGEQSRGWHEPSIRILTAAGDYLERLQVRFRALLHSDDPAVRERVSTQLRAEYDEALATLNTLRGWAELASVWVEYDAGLPMLSGARRSVEEGSDEIGSSEDDEDWDDNESGDSGR